MEAEMRTIVSTLTALVALAAVSAKAAPLPPAKSPAAELGAGPPIELARDGCGHGWYRVRWRDQWGYWHWGDCVPDRGPYGEWGAGWYYPYRDWRYVRPWGWGNP